MRTNALENKIKDLLEGTANRSFAFSGIEIQELGGIKVHEKNTLEFFNIYGEWSRYYSIYILGTIFFYEPHMDDRDRLWYNLKSGIISIAMKKRRDNKVEILEYKLYSGVIKISESKI